MPNVVDVGGIAQRHRLRDGPTVVSASRRRALASGPRADRSGDAASPPSRAGRAVRADLDRHRHRRRAHRRADVALLWSTSSPHIAFVALGKTSCNRTRASSASSCPSRSRRARRAGAQPAPQVLAAPDGGASWCSISRSAPRRRSSPTPGAPMSPSRPTGSAPGWPRRGEVARIAQSRRSAPDEPAARQAGRTGLRRPPARRRSRRRRHARSRQRRLHGARRPRTGARERARVCRPAPRRLRMIPARRPLVTAIALVTCASLARPAAGEPRQGDGAGPPGAPVAPPPTMSRAGRAGREPARLRCLTSASRSRPASRGCRTAATIRTRPTTRWCRSAPPRASRCCAAARSRWARAAAGRSGAARRRCARPRPP